MYGVVAGITAFGGVSALATTAAHADSTFTFTRIGGADRYATAGLFTAGAFPGGATTVYLADGLTGHQSDALAASGWGGVNNYGALLTDNTNTVPANTTSALSNNKVKNVVILGGANAVSQAQQTALSSAGYTVTRIAGNGRLDTMQALDDSIPPASVGKDSAGNPTAFLASGDDNHLVDALSSGGIAYGMKFPVILTSSSSSTLAAQAQQVITALGIKHLVVVGGTAAVPSSQYSPAPAGVTKVDVEAGADRSETSKVLSDFGIAQTPPWAKNSKMELARGDDGADALASAPYSGITDALSTCVTLTPSNPGSCPAFAQEHAATLKGASVIAGLQAAVTDAAANQVLAAGGNSGGLQAGNVSVIQGSAAQGSTINGSVTSPGSVQSLTVTGCGFNNQSVTFDPNSGNFTLTVPAAAPVGSCNLVFTATKTAAAGGGTQTTTVPFTVNQGGATGACVTGPTGATNPSGSETPLPQLCSAKILGTAVVGNAQGAPPGTTVQYVFSQKVTGDALAAAGFRVYDYGDDWYSGQGAGVDPSNANAVDVFFGQTAPTGTGAAATVLPGNNLQTTAGAGNLTLATVGGTGDAAGVAVTAPAGAGPDGATPIGASSSTPGASAGNTSAPNPESWAIVGPAATTAPNTYGNSTTISVTFDKAAFTQTAACTAGPICEAGYPATYPGQTAPTISSSGATGFDIVTAATSAAALANNNKANEIECYGPNPSNIASNPGGTPSGGAVPGGNGSTTITIVCPNSVGGPTVSASTLTAAQIARVIVQADAVGVAPPTTGACPAATSGVPGGSTGMASGPNGGGTNVCNPLSAADSARNTSDSPDLTGVAFQPGTGGNPDTIVYTFDQPVKTFVPADFGWFVASGAEIWCGTAPAANCTVTQPAGFSFNQVLLTVGTAAGPTGSGVTANGTGAFVSQGGVTGVNAPNNKNGDDEFGAANPNNAATTITPGAVGAPQLLNVHVAQTTNPVTGITTITVIYTFDQPLAAAVTNTGFHLYDADGTMLTAPAAAGSCTVGASGTSTPNNTQVVCASNYTTPSAGVASTGQITGATLGTVDYGTVTGAAVGTAGPNNTTSTNTSKNPEGGVKTS